MWHKLKDKFGYAWRKFSPYNHTTKSWSTLLNHSRNGGGIGWNWYHNKNVMNSMKMKSKHGMKLLELSTLSHKWGEYHHSCFMLTLFWTISAAKNSITFVMSFPHSLPYPHAQPTINFSTKCSSQIQQSMTFALCQNVNDTVAILGCWTAWHF